ncbi:ADP-ribose pyrophosphatase, mitochondrial-like isoform X1 [Chiloscyllium plagiosum]|uniref:ADP-ribose pyrophosphatase, mitochondrial-like isoform X1 n=2 Tax=Chiloscyllium plagiosum TaxID=36176 RepID=UPI001CB7D841|nr:ADP-ribose pyrophosphatase, mitochondrial-like isoform X1 [Chiloscyllium plagiosum]
MSVCIVCTALLCWIWIRHSVCLTQSSWYKPATYPVCHASHHNMGNRPMIHVKARSSPYPGSQVQRFTVPDSYVSWSLAWPEYEPVDYTAGSVQASPEWADPDFRKTGQSEHGPKFNALDGKIDRRSYLGCYELDEDKLPQNPMGRTGITSRGLLGKWGPNHAADPIVTRWKREAGEKVIHEQSGKPILQFVTIKRKDCGEWAIPGGMVDDGELVSVTLKREFGEEALDSLAASTSEKNRLRRLFQSIFSKENSKEVYAGYVDDPRNTDNAWVETVAINFHDETGDSVGQLDLHSGDDAGSVQWADIDQNLQLYATHSHFLKSVTELRDAHW